MTPEQAVTALARYLETGNPLLRDEVSALLEHAAQQALTIQQAAEEHVARAEQLEVATMAVVLVEHDRDDWKKKAEDAEAALRERKRVACSPCEHCGIALSRIEGGDDPGPERLEPDDNEHTTERCIDRLVAQRDQAVTEAEAWKEDAREKLGEGE